MSLVASALSTFLCFRKTALAKALVAKLVWPLEVIGLVLAILMRLLVFIVGGLVSLAGLRSLFVVAFSSSNPTRRSLLLPLFHWVLHALLIVFVSLIYCLLQI
jgi:hypothetical protein